MQALVDRIPEIPGFWLIAGLSLGTIAVAIAIVVVSWVRLRRQRRAQVRAVGGDWQAVAALKTPARLPEIIAALLPVAVAATSARLVQGSRNLLLTALNLADPSDRARLAAQGLSGAFNGTAMGLWAVPLAALLGGLAVALAIGARLRAVGLRRAESLAARADDASAWLKFPAPKTGVLVAAISAFLLLGFAPLARAGFAAMAVSISHFAATAGLPPQDKGAIISEGIDRSTRLLDQGFVVARGGVAVAALIAVYLAWRFSPARARAGVPGGSRPVHREGLFGPIIALAVIAAAVAGFMAARPMRQENALPWPPYVGGERPLSSIATADLEGPDELERAPVIELTPRSMGLDGVESNAEALASKLGTLTNLYRDLRPDHPVSGQSLIICQADTPISRLEVALHATVQGGAPHPTFGFLRREITDRPLLGRRWRNVGSAARTTVVEADLDKPKPGAAIIEVRRFPTCAAISAEIIAARRAGHEVALLLPAPPSLR